jgi:hypothetical protein
VDCKRWTYLNINLYWGNSRIPLRYLPWTQFNAELRYWQNYIGRPIAFSIFGQGQIYIGPVPDQVYTIDLDTVILPTDMVNLTAQTPLTNRIQVPVKFYAAYLAKYYEQSFGEAEIYLQQYKQQTQAVLASTYTRRIPDPYSNIVLTMAAAEQKKSYEVVKQFKGVNTKANRTAIGDDEFYWLENAMPIGYGNLKVTAKQNRLWALHLLTQLFIFSQQTLVLLII